MKLRDVSCGSVVKYQGDEYVVDKNVIVNRATLSGIAKSLSLHPDTEVEVLLEKSTMKLRDVGRGSVVKYAGQNAFVVKQGHFTHLALDNELRYTVANPETEVEVLWTPIITLCTAIPGKTYRDKERRLIHVREHCSANIGISSEFEVIIDPSFPLYGS